MGEQILVNLADKKGGDIITQAGKGWSPDPAIKPTDGSIIFKDADGVEMLRMDPGGQFSIKGEPVGYNEEAYEAAVQFFTEVLSKR